VEITQVLWDVFVGNFGLLNRVNFGTFRRADFHLVMGRSNGASDLAFFIENHEYLHGIDPFLGLRSSRTLLPKDSDCEPQTFHSLRKRDKNVTDLLGTAIPRCSP